MRITGSTRHLARNDRYRRAARLFDQGLFAEAVTEFASVQDSLPDDAVSGRLVSFYLGEAHASLGHAAFRRGSWAHAEEHFREASRINPRYADLHFHLAQALRHQVRLGEAIDELNRALEINPRYAKARYVRGITRYALGYRDEGIADIRSAVEFDPCFDGAAVHGGLDAHASGDYAAALHALQLAEATDVDDIQFHFGLGNYLHRNGMVFEAVGEYRKALDLNPDYADVRNQLGMALLALCKVTEAADEFRHALRLNPGFVDAWLNLSTALRELGDQAGAADATAQARTLDPRAVDGFTEDVAAADGERTDAETGVGAAA